MTLSATDTFTFLMDVGCILEATEDQIKALPRVTYHLTIPINQDLKKIACIET